MIALGCAVAFGLPACFNPQPEPPGKTSEFDPEDGGGSDAATGTSAANGTGSGGAGGGGGGGEGGQGGATGSPPAPFDLSQGTVTVSTSGGATNLVKPSIDHDLFDGTMGTPSESGASAPSLPGSE